MPHLHPDDPHVIERIFDTDDKSLRRAGFKMPAELRVYADDARPKATITQALGYIGMPPAHAEAYAFALESGLSDERAYE